MIAVCPGGHSPEARAKELHCDPYSFRFCPCDDANYLIWNPPAPRNFEAELDEYILKCAEVNRQENSPVPTGLQTPVGSENGVNLTGSAVLGQVDRARSHLPHGLLGNTMSPPVSPTVTPSDVGSAFSRNPPRYRAAPPPSTNQLPDRGISNDRYALDLKKRSLRSQTSKETNFFQLDHRSKLDIASSGELPDWYLDSIMQEPTGFERDPMDQFMEQRPEELPDLSDPIYDRPWPQTPEEIERQQAANNDLLNLALGKGGKFRKTTRDKAGATTKGNVTTESSGIKKKNARTLKRSVSKKGRQCQQ